MKEFVMRNDKLSTWHWKSQTIVAGWSQLNLVLNRLVHHLGDLDLGHGGLGNLNLGHGVGESTIWVSVTESSVSVWKSGVGEDGGGSGFLSGLFISRSLTAGLSLSEARNCESKHVGAAGLLDGVGHVGNLDLDLLDYWLVDMGGVGVGQGGSQGVGVAKVLGRRGSNQDTTHQLKIKQS